MALTVKVKAETIYIKGFLPFTSNKNDQSPTTLRHIKEVGTKHL